MRFVFYTLDEFQQQEKTMISNHTQNSIKGTYSLESFKKMREDSPIKCADLIAQAHLHKAMRKAKLAANFRCRMVPLGTSNNSVYQLLSFRTKTPVAYFKLGAAHEPTATGKMEELVWQIACIMGSPHFVPTITTKIYYALSTNYYSPLLDVHAVVDDAIEVNQFNKSLDVKIRDCGLWLINGELVYPKPNAKFMKGSFQISQSGISLAEWKVNSIYNSTIRNQELFSAVIASVLFSLWDAHLENIFIVNGRIMFIDNSRSLPNSNGATLRKVSPEATSHYHKSSFRCSLLDLEGALQPLNKNDIESIKKQIENYESKFPLLMKYIADKKIKQRIEGLPDNWLNPSAFDAMKERIILMKAAITEIEIKERQGCKVCLTDFVLQALPKYKFFVAIEILKSFVLEEVDPYYSSYEISLYLLMKELHSKIGYSSLESTLKLLGKHHMDLTGIIEFCNSKDNCYLHLIRKCANNFKVHSHKIYKSKEDLDKAKKSMNDFVEQYKSIAVKDYKDMNPKKR